MSLLISVYLLYLLLRKGCGNLYFCGFAHFSFQFHHSFSMYFEALIRYINISCNSCPVYDWTLYYYEIIILIPSHTLCSESTLFGIIIATLGFSWLALVWYVLFHPLSFNIAEYLHLKWVTGGQHIVMILNIAFHLIWQPLLSHWGV